MAHSQDSRGGEPAWPLCLIPTKARPGPIFWEASDSQIGGTGPATRTPHVPLYSVWERLFSQDNLAEVIASTLASGAWGNVATAWWSFCRILIQLLPPISRATEHCLQGGYSFRMGPWPGTPSLTLHSYSAFAPLSLAPTPHLGTWKTYLGIFSVNLLGTKGNVKKQNVEKKKSNFKKTAHVSTYHF